VRRVFGKANTNAFADVAGFATKQVPETGRTSRWGCTRIRLRMVDCKRTGGALRREYRFGRSTAWGTACDIGAPAATAAGMTPIQYRLPLEASRTARSSTAGKVFRHLPIQIAWLHGGSESLPTCDLRGALSNMPASTAFRSMGCWLIRSRH